DSWQALHVVELEAISKTLTRAVNDLLPAHCARIPAALMIGHHFSISDRCNVPSASGVCCSRGTISSPRADIHWRAAGSARTATTAALSFSIIFFGVPLGAQNALQTEVWNPDNPASSAVGMSGAIAIRVLPVNANALMLPARTCGSDVVRSATTKSI